MATWPATGDTDWNTKMKANIDIGHDSDGTHKKSQMLTDMGWSPTSYTGEESVTLPSGLIMKSGYQATPTASDTVTFETEFPGGIVSIGTTLRYTEKTAYGLAVNNLATTGFDYYTSSAYIGFYWIVIGY